MSDLNGSYFNRVRLKFALTEPFIYGANEAALETNPDWPRFVRITDIDDSGNLRRDTFKSLSPELAQPYLLEDGDLLLARSGATVGKAFLYKSSWGKACFAGYLIRARLKKITVLPLFAYFFSQSSIYWRQIHAGTIQATIQNFSAQKYGEITIPIPPISDQREIVCFLNKATSQIDNLIEAKESMLQLLEQKRATLISRAVTRGLDPKAPTKPSGRDWLGKIPEHWEIERAKNLFTVRDERSVDGEEELLTVSHITGVTSRAEKEVYMFKAEDMAGYKRCMKDDFTTNTLWAWMGAMGVSPLDGIVSPDYHVYTSKGQILPEFMELLCRSKPFVAEVIRWSKGVWSSRLRLYPENFFEIRFPVPPKSEQEEIVAAIADFKEKTAELTEALGESILLLKERRSALITAAVTGQIPLEEMTA